MPPEAATPDNGTFTIRPVTRQDFNQWLPLWDGYDAFYGAAVRAGFQHPDG
jgi:hypothetical protein